MAVRIELAGQPTLIDAADLRIARLSALAVQVFGSRSKAQRWLRRPRTARRG